MATLGQLVERVKNRLGGATTTSVAVLQSTIDASALSIPLDTVDGFSRGVAEIDLELIRVNGLDAGARTLRVPAFGRGYQGTTAASHAAGVEVMFNPTWRSAVIAEEINGVLGQVYPDLYPVKVHETTFPAERRKPIDLPEDATGVVSVWIGRPDLPDEWVREDRWYFNQDASDVGTPLRVGGHWLPGYPVRIVYATAPGLFDLSAPGALAADFTETTGFDERLEDLLALGVASRLAPFIEVQRLPVAGAEARAMTEAKPPGHSVTTARFLSQQFQQRLAQEVRALHRRHPIRVHKTR